MVKLFNNIVFYDFSSLKGEHPRLIIHEFRKHARAQEWDENALAKVIDEAMSGDYEHLWNVICLHSETKNT